MYRGSYYFCFALIGVLLLGLLFGGSSNDENHEATAALLFPGLQSELAEIRTLQFEFPGLRATLERQDGFWTVKERDGYAADQSQVVDLLRQFGRAVKLERKTQKPELFPRLGVDDSALKVRIGEDRTAWLGNQSNGRGGRYIRIGDSEVWLISAGLVGAAADPAAWLDKTIIDVPPEQLRAITISHKGETLDATIEADTVQLSGLKPEQLAYPGVANSLSRMLSDIRLIDVASTSQLNFTDSSRLTAELVDGSRLELQLLEQDERYWLRMPNESGRVFEISRFTYDSMTKTIADFTNETDANND